MKNYTGDRLHFGIAAEQAKAEGYKACDLQFLHWRHGHIHFSGLP